MNSPKQLLKDAQEALRAGKPELAEPLLREALKQDPAFGEARYELGGVLHQLGRQDEASLELEVVSAQASSNPAVWLRLGDVRFAQGRLDKAVVAYRHVISIDPAIVSAHNNLGNALLSLGLTGDAAQSFREAARLAPARHEPWNNLGVALMGLADYEGAAEAFGKAANLAPAFAAAWVNLATALSHLGRAAQAEPAARHSLTLAPQLPEAHNVLGNILSAQGKREEARESYGRAAALRPNYVEAHLNLGRLAMEEGGYDLAQRHYRHALSHDPASSAALDALGVAQAAMGRTDEAIRSHEQAIARNPSFADAYVNLGNALTATARIAEAKAAFKRAIALNAQDRAASQNFLMCLNYDETTDAKALSLEHRRWGDYQEKRITVLPGVAKAGGKLPKPLRLGLVSADFKRHSVAYFLEPLLEALNREEVQLYLYADVANPDEVTERLKGYAHVWRDLMGLSDEQAAKQVRDDGIHILIDLSGHTAGNRLPLFVLKPAPVQASWLGYPASTGLSRIDWRITDAFADPEDGKGAERLARLPGFLCYRPDENAPQPAPSPALANGFVTFGSFNALAKLTERDLSLIGRILKQVPQSRFLLKARPLADEGVKKRLYQRLDHHGIDPLQVELLGRVPETGGHLALYARIDIALDPVHYNGTATSCEALWMGLPLVTLAGSRHAQRVGASILSCANLPHLIANDEAAYVALAAKLASDIPALASQRESQRAILAASPLMDKQAFAASFTQALAKMWEGPKP
ncbi:MAG: tetratricopeptide repeat protein [Alphaproteobacteria bacterium]|nr:tetratricopeptide repeat protein [Alphaproteobacteria bacterium]